MRRTGATRGARFALALALTALAAMASRAGSPVERGDLLRVEVMTAPEFSREARVDADGRIALPALGSIEVAGRDTDAITEEIAATFAARGILNAPFVLVEVLAYRPVYVGGQVGRPGAIDFVPGMTARQAVIGAGGARRLPGMDADGTGDILSHLAEREALAFALAQVRARILRMEAELAGRDSLVDDAPDGAASARPAPPAGAKTVPPQAIAAHGRVASSAGTMGSPGAAADHAAIRDPIRDAEAALLSERLRHDALRQDHATRLLGFIEDEIATLARQAALQDAEAEIQEAEIANTRRLVERGLVPRSRLQDQLREQSRLSRDRLQSSAFEARARQAMAGLRFDLHDQDAARRRDTRLGLQDARREEADLAARIRRLDLAILSAGAGTDGVEVPGLVLYRTAEGRTLRIEAAPDDALRPGDVIEVTLPATARAPAAANEAAR